MANELRQNCLAWISDEQLIHEVFDYGNNLRTVSQNVGDQRRRVRLIDDYKATVDKAASAQDEEDTKQLSDAYKLLKLVATKRLRALEDIEKIDEIEAYLNNLTDEMAKITSTTVENLHQEEIISAEYSTANSVAIPRASQNSILAVRKNWHWLTALIHCAEIHLQNASNYHKFFHEANENAHWMTSELAKVGEKLQRNGQEGETAEAAKWLLELKEVLSVYLHWRGKVENMFEQSRKIVPIPQRVQPCDHQRPIISLCDYKTKEINISEGEELYLLDNSRHQGWLIRNFDHAEATVPSTICLIEGPDHNAIEIATRFRLQLLASWTNQLKRIGSNLIWFLLRVLHDWKEDELRMLRALPQNQKDVLLRCLYSIEESLSKYWAEYSKYKLLQSRIDRLRSILSESGNPSDYDQNWAGDMVLKNERANELVDKYKEFWRQWETYKILVETSSHPESLLLLEEWKSLQSAHLEDLLKRWHVHMSTTLDEDDLLEEMATSASSLLTQAANGHVREEDLIASSETVVAETENYIQSEQEEKRTFVITGVKNPRTGEQVSLTDAIKLNIINQSNGTYNDSLTGRQVFISEAMNRGDIRVEFTTTRKSPEKRRDVGLITIRTRRESRPYKVRAVRDLHTGEEVHLEEAIERGIVDYKRGTYKKDSFGETLTFAEAIEGGYIKVEKDTGEGGAETRRESTEVTATQTFAIHSVMDQRRQCEISFAEAVNLGLINETNGVYRHNVSGELISVCEAIKRGFIKATEVTPEVIISAAANAKGERESDKGMEREGLVKDASKVAAGVEAQKSDKECLGKDNKGANPRASIEGVENSSSELSDNSNTATLVMNGEYENDEVLEGGNDREEDEEISKESGSNAWENRDGSALTNHQ